MSHWASWAYHLENIKQATLPGKGNKRIILFARVQYAPKTSPIDGLWCALRLKKGIPSPIFEHKLNVLFAVTLFPVMGEVFSSLGRSFLSCSAIFPCANLNEGKCIWSGRQGKGGNDEETRKYNLLWVKQYTSCSCSIIYKYCHQLCISLVDSLTDDQEGSIVWQGEKQHRIADGLFFWK